MLPSPLLLILLLVLESKSSTERVKKLITVVVVVITVELKEGDRVDLLSTLAHEATLGQIVAVKNISVLLGGISGVDQW